MWTRRSFNFLWNMVIQKYFNMINLWILGRRFANLHWEGGGARLSNCLSLWEADRKLGVNSLSNI